MGIAHFPNDGRYYLDVDAAVSQQDWANNRSLIYWRRFVRKTAGGGLWSGANAGNNCSVWSNVGTLEGFNNNRSYDFRAGTPADQWWLEGTFWLPHDAAGYANYEVVGAASMVQLGSAQAGSGVKGAPRIPKRPDPPQNVRFSEILPTSVRVSWDPSPNNQGQGVQLYLLRMWRNGSGTGPYEDVIQANILSYVATGLTPGVEHTFTVYAWNGATDNSGYSNEATRRVVRTLSGMWIKLSGIWRRAVPYVKHNGVWKHAAVFQKKGNSWVRPQ